MSQQNENFDIIFEKLEEAKQATSGWEITYPDVAEIKEIDVFRQLAQDVAETPIYESLTRG